MTVREALEKLEKQGLLIPLTRAGLLSSRAPSILKAVRARESGLKLREVAKLLGVNLSATNKYISHSKEKL